MTTLFETQAPRPLADRLRPQSLGDILGQDHLIGPQGPIGRMVASRQLASMILWGPPGCGKTTIARLLAAELSRGGTDLAFEPLSAVFSGVADLRKVFEAAKKRREMGHGTLLFVDEIHRFNRAQQDAFLPNVEDGTVILVGATTENPSFELIGALLSRAQVFVLRRLDDSALEALLARAEKHLGHRVPLTDDGRPPPVPRTRVATPPGEHPLLEFSHPALALTGLAFWFAFVLIHDRPLAWISFGVLVITVGAGLSWLAANALAVRRREHAARPFPPRLIVFHGLAATVALALTVLTAVSASHG